MILKKKLALSLLFSNQHFCVSLSIICIWFEQSKVNIKQGNFCDKKVYENKTTYVFDYNSTKFVQTLLYCRDALLFSLGLYLKSFKKICYFLQKSFIFFVICTFRSQRYFFIGCVVHASQRYRVLPQIKTIFGYIVNASQRYGVYSKNKDNICCVVQK